MEILCVLFLSPCWLLCWESCAFYANSLENMQAIINVLNVNEQAKPETVEKVCNIVKKQLALPDDSTVTGESKFAALGADSLDTVLSNYLSAVTQFHLSLIVMVFSWLLKCTHLCPMSTG